MEIQQAIKDGYRIILLPGGSRSSKTISVIQTILVYFAGVNHERISIFRQSRTWLRATVWNDFREVLINAEMWNSNAVNLTQLSYFFNGNFIDFVGLDETQKLHGRKQDHAWFNEAMEIEWHDWNQILQRTPGMIFADWNPTDENHFLYKKVMKNPRAKVIHSTMLDNPFLEDELVKQIKSYEPTPENIEAGTASEYDWNVYGLGLPAKRDGAVYERWSEGSFREDLPMVTFLDHGYHPDPLACGQIAIDKENRKLYIRQIWYQTKMTEEDILWMFESHVPKEDIVVADTSDTRINDLLRERGWDVQDADKRPGSVASGVKAIMDYEIIVDTDSHDVKFELNNYIWHNKKVDRPKDGNDHLLDGMRYAFMYYTDPAGEFVFIN